MYKTKLLFIKVFKRLKLIRYFNFHLSKTINRTKVSIPFINGMGISNFIIESDWLELLINQFLKENNNHAFIDVGVNIGQTLLRVKTLIPEMKYIGFEPNSSCNLYTQQLINSNNFRDCTIYPCALYSSGKFLELEKNTIADLGASIIQPFRPGNFKYKEQVFSVCYDSIFLNQSISIVKIDTEGAELEVIAGMKQSIIKHQPLIVCEVLDSHQPSVLEYTQGRASQLSDLLFSIKYSIIQFESSSEKHRIISYRKIDKFNIVQWTPRSLDLNDYLFCPSSREHEVMTALSKIID